MIGHRSLRVVALVTAALVASGCASMTPAERGCIVASVADIASTVAGMNSGATESNPALTLAGEDAATAVLTSAVLTVGWIALVRKVNRRNPQRARALFNVCTGLRSAVAIHNLNVASKAN